MSLLYPQLRREKDDKGRSQWVYGPNATKLYAGKVTNNVTQAVARIVMTDGMLRVTKKYPVVGTVHDEQIVLVPDDEVASAKTWVLEQMTMEPSICRGYPWPLTVVRTVDMEKQNNDDKNKLHKSVS
jgi:hypothetical protein